MSCRVARVVCERVPVKTMEISSSAFRPGGGGSVPLDKPMPASLLVFAAFSSPPATGVSAALPRRVRIDGQRFISSVTNATIVLAGPNVVVKGPVCDPLTPVELSQRVHERVKLPTVKLCPGRAAAPTLSTLTLAALPSCGERHHALPDTRGELGLRGGGDVHDV